MGADDLEEQQGDVGRISAAKAPSMRDNEPPGARGRRISRFDRVDRPDVNSIAAMMRVHAANRKQLV